MPSCAMRYCRNYTGRACKTQGITYHSFPSNAILRYEWIVIVRKQRREEDWMPNSSSKVCSVHFNDDDKYLSDKGLTLLRKSALPILVKDLIVNSDLPTPKSPKSIAEELKPKPVFESPREVDLKKQLARVTAVKERLITKNKNLTKQNTRLRKKVEDLTSLLEQFKDTDQSSQEQEDCSVNCLVEVSITSDVP